mgnify:CR=1 FL=1
MGEQELIIAALQTTMESFRQDWREDIGVVHGKIERVCTRVEVLERDKVARDAVSAKECITEEKKEKEETAIKLEKRQTWLYIVRAVAVACVIAIPGIIYMLVKVILGLKNVGILE